jgi:nitrilase
VPDQFPKVKVAAVHAASVFLDREKTLSKAVGLINDAARNGARLVVFPESFLPGFPFWINSHTPGTGGPLFFELFANAVEVPSETVEALGEAARAAGVYVVMGMTEREGGTLYNTLLYIDDQGQVIGKHRKLQPTHAERTIWGRGDGSDLVVCETPFGKLGGLICWEHTMDLIRYSMACLGEQIHVAVWPAISATMGSPNAPFFDSIAEAAAKHHALSAQTFVINVMSCIDQATIERLGLEDRPDLIRVGGGWTAIVGPNGQIIAGPHRDEEAILYADLDLSLIVRAKFACDSVGHYARPDVVRLLVNRTPQNKVFENVVSLEQWSPLAKNDQDV